MDKKELAKKINEDVRVINAYLKGEIKSNMYTDEEIEQKREYFLSKVPSEKSNISLNRWHYEITRVFDLCKTFRECPDMWFYHLENFLN